MDSETYEVQHRLSDADRNVHYAWDNSIEPVLTIESGDVVRFECPDANNGDFDVETKTEEVPDIVLDPGHALVGPVAIEGASPGDVLQVELLEVRHRGWGWTAFWPTEANLGLLPEDFDHPGLKIWDLEGDTAHFVDGIEVPLDSFPGNIGVAPGADGEHHTIPPRDVGGNLDVKHLTEGSTVYFPIEVEDALFSVGDGHATQGDGEVCVTAIEAPIFLTARFRVRSDMDIEQPHFESTGPYTPTGRDEPMYGTTGISDDLRGATKKAIRHMIDHLVRERDLTRTQAHLLCSVAVDLKVNQVVDAPNWTISAYLPESIFP
jgi:acetamidase/formamidase